MTSSTSHDKDPIARQFALNLIAARGRAGVSQEELAFTADVHRTEIGQLERANRIPRIDTVIKLAGGLDMAPGDLLDGITWIPASGPRGTFATGESSERGG